MNITWDDVYKWIENSNPNRDARVIVADMESVEVYANCCMDEDNLNELRMIFLKYEFCTIGQIERTLEAYIRSSKKDIYHALDEEACFYNNESDRMVFRKSDKPVVKISDNLYVFRGWIDREQTKKRIENDKD